jgi:hypothetical protein
VIFLQVELEQPDPTGKTLVTTATLLHHALGHDLFKAYEGEEFDEIINGVRQWINLINPTESITNIMDKSGLAFIEIGKESAINAYRVKRWGLVARYEARQAALAVKKVPPAVAG